MWLRELMRTCARACLPPALFAVGVLAGKPGAGLLLAALTLLLPVARFHRFKQSFSLSVAKALAYAVHASLVVYPQFCGVVRYGMARLLGKPLLNRGVDYPAVPGPSHAAQAANTAEGRKNAG